MTFQVVFEECQIKQEIGPMHTFINDDNQDQNEDDDDDRGPSDNDVSTAFLKNYFTDSLH